MLQFLVREEDMKTRFLSLGLIFIMIISLAGCSGNTEEAEISEETDVFDEEGTGTEERDHGAERQKVRTKHLREVPILPFRSRIKIQGSNGIAAGISPAAFPLCRYGAVCNKSEFFFIHSILYKVHIVRNYQRPFPAECPGRFFAGQIPAALSDMFLTFGEKGIRKPQPLFIRFKKETGLLIQKLISIEGQIVHQLFFFERPVQRGYLHNDEYLCGCHQKIQAEGDQPLC